MNYKILSTLQVPSVSTVDGTSDQWSDTFSEYSSNSAEYAENDSVVQSASGDWNSNYTTVNSNSAVWTTGLVKAVSYRDQKSGGTSGGTFTAGAWQTRTLNTESPVNGVGSSLSSNQVTLPAGTYLVRWSAPALYTLGHQTRLYNVTDSSVVCYGSSEYCDRAGNGTQTRSVGSEVITIASTKTFRLEHRCNTTHPTNGLGVALNVATEVYAEITFLKLA
jgi:hypothetical protein